MLDAAIRTQLQTYFERIAQPIELVATLDGSAKSQELADLLSDIAALSDKIALRRDGARDGADARAPSFAIARVGQAPRVAFAGLPLGHEFSSLILALLQVGGVAPKESEHTLAQARALEGDHVFETFFSLSCQNCPDVVQALNALAAINPRVRHVAIDGALFQDEVAARAVMAVPSVFLNGAPFAQGRMTLDDILRKLDAGAVEHEAKRIAAKAPFDVLVVGGGPAGAAAAIYAARKGLRTGVVAERFGGQTLDTLAIENFISVAHTEGPRFAAALESHVRAHDVEIMTGQTATALTPARGDWHEIVLQNGAALQARSVILATGARWRQMNVPGEAEYRNKGVAYCPHCDGPLFKGKRVAVIGGGNSGVEAAIDLAGLAAHVTLIEYADALRADAVLQTKLRSLRNVTVVLSAQTTQVHGDGAKVTGLAYADRVSGAAHRLDLDGVFVQIGLAPNTDWLKDTLALSRHGEIEIDARGATSVPGVFAAGDATTTPYKQIVIAVGEGAKASLSAFDWLIRQTPADVEKKAA